MLPPTRYTRKLLVSAALVYALFGCWIGWAQHALFDSAKALVDRGTLELGPSADNNVDRLLIKGRYYSNKPIGATLLIALPYAAWKGLYTLAVPKAVRERDAASVTKFPSLWYPSVSVYDHLSVFERLGRVFVTWCTAIPLVLLAMWLLQRLAVELGASPRDGLLMAAALGFGTPVFFGTLNMFHDVMGMSLAFIGFFLLFQGTRSAGVSYMGWAGVVTGFAATVSQWTALSLPAYVVYAAMRGRARSLPVFFAGVLFGVAPQLLYQYALTGNPLVPAFVFHDPEIWASDTKRFLGFIPDPGYLLLTLPQVLFLPTRGVLFYAPVLVLAVAGLPMMFRTHRAEAVAIILVAAPVVLANAAMETWWGGSFGSRYIVSLIPLLLLPLAMVAGARRWLLLGLLAYSIVINVSATHLSDYGRLPVPNPQVSSSDFREQAKLGIVSNPVYDGYLRSLQRFGPRSRLLDSLGFDRSAVDLRPADVSVMGVSFDGTIPIGLHPPVGFLSVNTRHFPTLLLLLLLSLIWLRELSGALQRRLGGAA